MITKLTNTTDFDKQKEKYNYIRKRTDFLPENYGLEVAPGVYWCRVHAFLCFFPREYQFERYKIADYSEKIKNNSEEKKRIDKRCEEETEKCADILQQEADEHAAGIRTISMFTVAKWCGGFILLVYGLYATAASFKSSNTMESVKITSLPKGAEHTLTPPVSNNRGL